MPEHRTLEQLSAVARPFLRGGEFLLYGRSKLKVHRKRDEHPARRSPFMIATLRNDRTWFLHRVIPNALSLGGTDERTLCQLILWWRGLPRLPGRVLKWWQERDAAFCKSLDEVGYDDPLSLNCVLCGRPYIGLDWWSLGKVIGPCCSFGECGSCRQHANSR